MPLYQVSQSVEIIVQILIILVFSVKGATMDHTREGLFLTCCSDHLAVLAIVSHFDKVVHVGVVAWCVVHILSIGHRGDGLGQYWDSWATDPRRPTGGRPENI